MMSKRNSILLVLPLMLIATGGGECMMMMPMDMDMDMGTGTTTPKASLETIVSNTSGAAGLAMGEDGLYTVNRDGVFGPLAEGNNLSELAPLGATNLDDVLAGQSNALVLAISNNGDFWIGGMCCTTLAMVPAAGGDAVADLAEDATALNPETLAIVPAGDDHTELVPGQMIVGQETTFSKMTMIDVDGDGAETAISNPDDDKNRFGHHFTFGLDGNLYASRGTSGLTIFGIQMIANDGSPVDVPGTLGVSAETFVVLANGDMVIRGTLQTTGTMSTQGILYYNAEEDSVEVYLEMEADEASEDDEMVVTSDGATIYLSLPDQNRIVRVTLDHDA